MARCSFVGRPRSSQSTVAAARAKYGSLLACAFALLLAACSSVTQGPTVRIADSGWTVQPSSVDQPSGQFDLVVVNETAEVQRFLVVGLDKGEPDELPIVNGLLDTTRSCALAFRVVGESTYCGGSEQPPLTEIPSVAPGEEITISVGSVLGGGDPGRYVVLSHRPGGYEAGEFVAFTMALPPGVTEPPPAVEPTTRVWVVLESYTVDAAGSHCSGAGPTIRIAAGSAVEMKVYDRFDTLVDEVQTTLPVGSEIVAGRDDGLLLVDGAEAGCAFDLGEPFGGDTVGDWIDLFLDPHPEVAVEWARTEDGLVFWFGS